MNVIWMCGARATQHFADRVAERSIPIEAARQTLENPFCVRRGPGDADVVSGAVLTGGRRRWLTVVRDRYGRLRTAYWRERENCATPTAAGR